MKKYICKRCNEESSYLKYNNLEGLCPTCYKILKITESYHDKLSSQTGVIEKCYFYLYRSGDKIYFRLANSTELNSRKLFCGTRIQVINLIYYLHYYFGKDYFRFSDWKTFKRVIRYYFDNKYHEIKNSSKIRIESSFNSCEIKSSDIVYHSKLKYDKSRNILDPFIKEMTYVPCQESTEYFYSKYRLLHHQIWNITNNYDKDHIHKCPICGIPLEFKDLYHGFGKYCSRSCQIRGTMDHKNLLSFYSPHLKVFNKNPDDTKCYLYLAYNGYYKYDWITFGLYTEHINPIVLSNKYISYHVIQTGNKIDMMEVLFYLFNYYGDNWFESKDFTEFKIKFREKVSLMRISNP